MVVKCRGGVHFVQAIRGHQGTFTTRRTIVTERLESQAAADVQRGWCLDRWSAFAAGRENQAVRVQADKTGTGPARIMC